ncbi:thiol S-methyltransferase TMT1A-like [Panulirus ornatus]|uniref:thiol S-methyltransferase TMT1A-like n=1 Tax=Panulirus ornatus TaxID=150431 RepID=UPI003A85D7B8
MAEQNVGRMTMDDQKDGLNMVEVEDQGHGDALEGATSSSLWIYANLQTFVCLVAIFWVLRMIFVKTRPRWYSHLVKMCIEINFVKLEKWKEDLFAGLESIVSHDPNLRKKKAIKVLEIGVGTGANLPYYPKGTRLLAVDPNPYFKHYYDANRKRFPNINSEDMILTTGDKMDMIPDNSVDAVVITYVLCSVPNIDPVLREVLRVLAPGGKFYFLEHIAEFDLVKHGLRKKIQNVLDRVCVWYFIFNGCHLSRDTLAHIERTGFSSVDAQKYHAPVSSIIFDVDSPCVQGIAVK